MNRKTILARNFIIFIVTILFAVNSVEVVKAAGTTAVTPGNNQYLELRATEINTMDDGKQVIMELWGYNIDFQRI